MSTAQRILVVDDDLLFTKSTTAVLEAHGYQVSTAQDGAEALRRMSVEKPDLVLLDVMMDWPLEGVSVTRDMMEMNDLRGIPIIMVTSIKSSEYRGTFPLDEYLHIDAWLDKPCPPPRLVSEVKATLLRHSRFREAEPGEE